MHLRIVMNSSSFVKCNIQMKFLSCRRLAYCSSFFLVKTHAVCSVWIMVAMKTKARRGKLSCERKRKGEWSEQQQQ